MQRRDWAKHNNEGKVELIHVFYFKKLTRVPFESYKIHHIIVNTIRNYDVSCKYFWSKSDYWPYNTKQHNLIYSVDKEKKFSFTWKICIELLKKIDETGYISIPVKLIKFL